jgi:hypothetical protein
MLNCRTRYQGYKGAVSLFCCTVMHEQWLPVNRLVESCEYCYCRCCPGLLCDQSAKHLNQRVHIVSTFVVKYLGGGQQDYNGVNLPNMPLFPVTGFLECCALCRARSDCRGWTKYIDSCYLKSFVTASGLSPMPGALTGAITLYVQIHPPSS